MNRREFSKEFKQDAISLVLGQGYTRTEAAKSLEIPHFRTEMNSEAKWERDLSFFPISQSRSTKLKKQRGAEHAKVVIQWQRKH